MNQLLTTEPFVIKKVLQGSFAETVLTRVKESNKPLYVSGPITGYKDLNAPAFQQAETYFKEIDIKAINPLKLIHPQTLKDLALHPNDEWCYCMRIDLINLMHCKAIVMLPNWKKSPGATWEFLNAKALKIPALNIEMEHETLTEPEYAELLYNIISKIKTHDFELGAGKMLKTL